MSTDDLINGEDCATISIKNGGLMKNNSIKEAKFRIKVVKGLFSIQIKCRFGIFKYWQTIATSEKLPELSLIFKVLSTKYI